MKQKCAIAVMAGIQLLTGVPFFGAAQDIYRNYVMKTVHTDADSTQTKRQTVAYYDGLGRPIQTLLKGASPDGHDLADHFEYDSLGRESRTWQTIRSPYSNGGPVDSAMFVPTAAGFYGDMAPFRETRYDNSPLNRVRKVTGPGNAWHQADKGVTSVYLTNSESIASDSLYCKKYSFVLSGNTGISFGLDILHPWPSGSLLVSRTEDEDGRTQWVFKDMRNLVVLERRLAEASQGDTPATYADTYYLYDDAGQLIAVLPPELSAYFADGSWSGSTETAPKVEGFAYQYRYDARGRMIAKKLPGAAWTYYIYDKGDRLVLTQDGNQRARGEWSFRLQDILGRECLTGIMQGTYNAFSNPLGNVQVVVTRERGAGNYGAIHDYAVSGLSLPGNAEVLTVNFWDDYSFLNHESGMTYAAFSYVAPTSDEAEYGKSYGTEAQGLLTGRWCKTLGDAPSMWADSAVRETWYYDDHGRTVFHVKGYPSGNRMIERMGYSFAGELTNRLRTMQFPDNTGKTEEYIYTYDSWGRLKDTFHSLSGTTIKLASNNYDVVGRLASTSRGGTSVQNSPAALASSYSYNVRDWLMEIKGPLFSETLFYETKRPGNALASQWAGNISSAEWKTSASPLDSTWYDYGYDLLGRLTQAKLGHSSSPTDLHDRTYSYDLNGNMKSRIRPDHAFTNMNEERENRWVWSQPDGNRPVDWTQMLYKMTTIPPSHPWQSPQTVYELDPYGQAEEQYVYDVVGNRTSVLDAQGDTLSVTAYNQLNLPEEYRSANGDTVRHVYSAEGEKLFVKEIPSTGSSTGTEYAANYRIENGTITMIHTDAGYYSPVMPPPGVTGPVYSHIWYLKDHLGNNRVLADSNGNAIAVNDYDPFGESISVAGSYSVYPFPPCAKESPNKYGGMEWNETTSTYDFEARQFSPAFHRFTTMDPLAEKYYHISPYAYCAGNPINRIDPNGKEDYKLNRDGTLSATGKGVYDPYDRLISDHGESIVVRDKKLIEEMRDCPISYFVGEDAIEEGTMHYTVTSVDRRGKKEMQKIFKFLADNSDVEWDMLFFDEGYAVLATDHLSSVFYNASLFHYLQYQKPEVYKSKLSSKIHSHPAQDGSEEESTAHDETNAKYAPDIFSYVYFSASGTTFLITGNGTTLIGTLGDLEL